MCYREFNCLLNQVRRVPLLHIDRWLEQRNILYPEAYCAVSVVQSNYPVGKRSELSVALLKNLDDKIQLVLLLHTLSVELEPVEVF